MNPTPDEVAAGHAFYTSRSLAIYDLAILGYFSRLAWRCPAGRVLRQYDDHVTANHLDIGVGTGYFLDRRRFPSPSLLVLMDLNEACLTKAANASPVTNRCDTARAFSNPSGSTGPRSTRSA